MNLITGTPTRRKSQCAVDTIPGLSQGFPGFLRLADPITGT